MRFIYIDDLLTLIIWVYVVSAILHWLIAKDKLKKYVEKDHTDLNKSDMYKWQHGKILRIDTLIHSLDLIHFPRSIHKNW